MLNLKLFVDQVLDQDHFSAGFEDLFVETIEYS